MSVVRGLLTAFVGVNYLLIMLGLAGSHIWTVYIAYQIDGKIPAIITLFTPPFAEIYWAYASWRGTGLLFNGLAQVYALVAVLYVVQVIAALLLFVTEPKKA